MGVLGFMIVFNVVYYQFSISAATIWFFCVLFTYYLIFDSRGDTAGAAWSVEVFKLEVSAQGYGKHTNKQSNDFR